MSGAKKPTWRRVLYEHQPFPDNWFDDQKFLDQLQLSSPVVSLSSIDLLHSITIVADQFTAVSLFLTIYKYLVLPGAAVAPLICFDFVLLFIGYITHWAFDNQSYDVKSSFFYCILFCGYLRIISPILQSLTSSYSEDTIHACSFFFSTVHLVSQDYSYINGTTHKFTGTLSLNAAMFTAVLLASRLDTLKKTAVFILLAVILFCFFPSTIRVLKKRSLFIHIVLTTLLWLATSCLLFNLDYTLLFAYEITVCFVSIICPFWLKYVGSKYKKSLRGPWDIAEIPEVDKEE